MSQCLSFCRTACWWRWSLLLGSTLPSPLRARKSAQRSVLLLMIWIMFCSLSVFIGICFICHAFHNSNQVWVRLQGVDADETPFSFGGALYPFKVYEIRITSKVYWRVVDLASSFFHSIMFFFTSRWRGMCPTLRSSRLNRLLDRLFRREIRTSLPCGSVPKRPDRPLFPLLSICTKMPNNTSR